MPQSATGGSAKQGSGSDSGDPKKQGDPVRKKTSAQSGGDEDGRRSRDGRGVTRHKLPTISTQAR